MTHASPHAASAANRGILRKIAILLVSEIIAFPSSVRCASTCLAQVDFVLRSTILRGKCKIAKLMCAQKPHRGCLHNAHIRPEGEGKPFRPYGAPSWRRQGKAPPAGKKSPLKKAISKFGVRAQHTVLVRMMHASP